MTLSKDDFLNKVKQLDLQRQKNTLQTSTNSQSQLSTIVIPHPVARAPTKLSSKEQGFLSSDEEDEDGVDEDLKYKSAYNYEKSLKNGSWSSSRTNSTKTIYRGNFEPKHPEHPEDSEDIAPKLPKRPAAAAADKYQELISSVPENEQSQEFDPDEIDQFRQSMGGSYVHHEKVAMPDIIRFDDYKSSFNERYAKKHGTVEVETKHRIVSEEEEEPKKKNGFALSDEQRRELDSKIGQLIYNEDEQMHSPKKHTAKPVSPPKPAHLIMPVKLAKSNQEQELRPKLPTRPTSEKESHADSPLQTISKSPKKLNLSTYTKPSKEAGEGEGAEAEALALRDIPEWKLPKSRVSPPKPPKSRFVSQQDDIRQEEITKTPSKNPPPAVPKKSSSVVRKVSENSARLLNVKSQLKPPASGLETPNRTDSKPSIKPKPEALTKISLAPVKKPIPSTHHTVSPTSKDKEEGEEEKKETSEIISFPKLRPTKPTSKPTSAQLEAIQKQSEVVSSQSPSKLKELEKSKRIVSGNKELLNKSLRGLRSVGTDSKETHIPDEQDVLRRSLRGLKSVKTGNVPPPPPPTEMKNTEGILLKSSLNRLKPIRSKPEVKPKPQSLVESQSKLSATPQEQQSPKISNRPLTSIPPPTPSPSNQSKILNHDEQAQQQEPSSRTQTKSILEGLMLRKIQTDPSLPITSTTSSSTESFNPIIIKKAQSFDTGNLQKSRESTDDLTHLTKSRAKGPKRRAPKK